MSGTIVCGVSTGEEARSTARLAHELAERLGLRLVLLHAVDVPRASQESVSGRQQRRGAAQLLAEIEAELAGDGDEVVSRVELGDPVELLAWVAAEERAALVVLGSRPHGLRRRGIRCGLAAALAHATPVPVLVSPPQPRARSVREPAVAGAPLVG
jgi:nucleotide-binding universal stress UspA family protein